MTCVNLYPISGYQIGAESVLGQHNNTYTRLRTSGLLFAGFVASNLFCCELETLHEKATDADKTASP